MTLETSIAFNAIYRQADQKTLQMITQFNERLDQSGTPGTLSVQSAKAKEPVIEIGGDVLAPFDKILYQHKNKTQLYRDALLDMAIAIVQSIDTDKLKQQMETLAEEYTNLLDAQLEDDLSSITEALQEAPKEISREDYDQDTALLKQVQNIIE